ncbi:TonB-dependent receptor [bacterium]|nr:TonB-dependent receptor [bacterium]
MNRTLLFTIVLAAVSVVQAQIITVKDAESHQPLRQVSIYTRRPLIFRETDSSGTVDITPFQGQKAIHIELIGYEPQLLGFADLARSEYLVLLKPQPLLMEPVVVSASRWQQQQRQVPNRISVVTAPQRRFYAPQTAADLLEYSGDVFIQKSQLGGGSPIIRGFSANRILISVDGVRMNTAIFRSGNLQNVIALDPFATEHTEILFGPGSALYGSDAIGGVLNFSTLAAELSGEGGPRIRGESALRISTANSERTGHADIRIGLRKWALVSSISYTGFGDQLMGTDGPREYLLPAYADRVNGTDVRVENGNPRMQRPSGYSQLNALQKIRFSPDPAWEVIWASHLSESSDIPRYDRLIETTGDGTPKYARWYYGPQVWHMHALTVQNSRPTPVADEMKLVTAWQFFKESRHDRKFGSGGINHRTEQNRVLSFNLDLKKRSGRRGTFYYGIETVLNRVSSRGVQENIGTGEKEEISPRYPDGSVWNSYGAYGKYDYRISESFTVQSSLRYTRIFIEAAFDTLLFPYPLTRATLKTGALTGSLGCLWDAGGSNQLRVNISSGFRAPNIDDLGKVFDSEPGSVVVPNPDLGPEQAWNIDISWHTAVGGRLTCDLTGYYTHLTGAMVRRDAVLNGQDSIYYDGTLSKVQHLTNAADAFVRGVQAGVTLDLPCSLRLTTQVSYQYGREQEEDSDTYVPLRHAVPWFGITSLTWRSGPLRAEFYAHYSGGFRYAELPPSERSKPQLYAVDDSGRPFSPGWYTLNLKAQYDLSDRFALNAGLENITGQRYRPYSSGIAAPGLNGILMLTARL